MSQQGRTETPKKPRMELSIAYCVTCNYRPIAAGLARSIEEATGLKTLLIPSREAGAFEVVADGEVIFSKKKSGRFPGNSEVLDSLSRRDPSHQAGVRKG